MYGSQSVRAANADLVKSMFEALADALPGPAETTVGSLTGRHAHLVAAYEPMAGDDDRAQGHVVFATGLLAAYEHARRHLPRQEALALVRSSMLAPVADSNREGTAQALDHAEDPFALMVGFSRDREENYFGPSFAFTRERDDRSAYHLAVDTCFYHRVLTAANAPEVTAVACDWDQGTWGAGVDPDRHGFTFRLPETIGRGAPRCRFLFDRRDAES